MGVSFADAPMAGFERHAFRCSACAHIARRLVLSRPPSIVQHPKPPATRLQTRRVAVLSPRVKLSANFRTRRRAAENPAEAFNWEEAFANLRSEDTPIQERPEPVRSSGTFKPVEKPPTPPTAAQEPSAQRRTSAWLEAVEKVHKRQSALQERATTQRSTPVLGRTGRLRTTAGDGHAQEAKKPPSRTWAEAVDELRRTLAALTEQAASSMREEPAEPCEALKQHQNAKAFPNDPAAPRSAWERARSPRRQVGS
jgi:hypothetical protein